MQENRKFLWMVVVLLALVAAALGYGVYNRYAPAVSGVMPSVGTNNGNSTTQTTSPQGTQTSESGVKLSEAEARVLAGVSGGATEAERQVYTDSVIGLAKDAEQIILLKCIGAPLVSKASKLKGEVTFRNDDNTSHLLAFNNGKDKFTIPAKESKKIKPSFGNGLGFYTYTCDNQTAGIVILGE